MNGHSFCLWPLGLPSRSPLLIPLSCGHKESVYATTCRQSVFVFLYIWQWHKHNEVTRSCTVKYRTHLTCICIVHTQNVIWTRYSITKTVGRQMYILRLENCRQFLNCRLFTREVAGTIFSKESMKERLTTVGLTISSRPDTRVERIFWATFLNTRSSSNTEALILPASFLSRTPGMRVQL